MPRLRIFLPSLVTSSPSSMMPNKPSLIALLEPKKNKLHLLNKLLDSTQLNAFKMLFKLLLMFPISLMTFQPRKIFLPSSTTYKSPYKISKRPSPIVELVKLWTILKMLLILVLALKTSNKPFKSLPKLKLTSIIRTFPLSSMMPFNSSTLLNRLLLIAQLDDLELYH